MRVQRESTTAIPRRIVYINSPPSESPYQIRHPYLASVVHFFRKPQSLPLVLGFFLFLTWISIRMQRTSQFSALNLGNDAEWSTEDDLKANLVRFSSGFPSQIAKDNRGWLLDPVSLAHASGITGGAVTCASIHVGEIRPGRLRGNHRHHDCNETLVIWGGTTRFRMENSKVADNGYAEVIVGADEIAVAASPSGSAHALVNIDPIHSTFFIGCQDKIINYNASSTDFNVWKDL